MRPPLEEYAERQAAREAAATRLDRVHVHLGNAKVAVFLIAVIYAGWQLGGEMSTTFYVAAAVLFAGLSIWHELVMRAMARARAAVDYYVSGRARIEDTWMRDEPSGARFSDKDHPYADDLDVFGPRSLFQLISTCRTPVGEERLASWLLRASTAAEIRDRQSLVGELRDRLDLRERIAVVNAGRRRSFHAERLIAWAEDSSRLPPVRVAVLALAGLFAAAVFNYFNGGNGVYLGASLAINLLVMLWLAKRANAVVESLSGATESAALDLLSNVVTEIEREPFDRPALTALAAQLRGSSEAMKASRGLARLARISDWADSRHNVFVRLSEIPLLFTLQLAYAADSWRARYGRSLRIWVDVVGEMEALLSLAGYSYEHPADPFPEIVEQADALFDAEEIAHPLLPAARAVSNSLTLGVAGAASEAPGSRVFLVSGSNMSGKSTLMRTVGINALLALAGAPVRARRLRLTPLVIGTCLRHTDSLQERRSGFYTEALRIRLICDLLDGPLPVLFLFDELLSGTNSKDRRIAAEGVVRIMLARRAIGMVTTHDLSLTEIAAIFPGDVRNVHLLDRVVDGKMLFDYKLREGVITHSNALDLMRIIGLDV